MRQLAVVGCLVIGAVVSATLALRAPPASVGEVWQLRSSDMLIVGGARLLAQSHLQVEQDRFSFRIHSADFQITGSGRARLHESDSAQDVLRLQIAQSSISGDWPQLPATLAYQWLQVATPGRELHLLKRGACWQVRESYWRLCPFIASPAATDSAAVAPVSIVKSSDAE